MPFTSQLGTAQSVLGSIVLGFVGGGASINPSAQFAQPSSSGSYAQSVVANQSINPATFQPNPSALYPQPWTAGAYADSPTINRRIDPASFQPSPSGAFPQPFSAGQYSQSHVSNQWINPAIDQPQPRAPFVQPWSGGRYAQSDSLNRRIDPANFQPNPSAQFPNGAATIYALGSWASSFIATPPSVIASANYPSGSGSTYVAATWSTPFVAPPASFVPAPSFPSPWSVGSYALSVVANQWINPAAFQPSPSGSFPQPWAANAYMQSWAGVFVPTPPAVNPTASYPQRQPDQWHIGGDWATPKWIDPALFRPTPSAQYTQPWSAGWYTQSTVCFFVAVPPAVNPSASYPQRAPEQWHAPSDWVTPLWIDPAVFRPSPSAVFAQPWNAGSYAQSPASSFIVTPPAVNPSASYPQPWLSGSYRLSELAIQRPAGPAPVQPPSVVYATPWIDGSYARSEVASSVQAPVVVLPSAVYPQRQPDQWRLDGNWITPVWIDPATFRPIPLSLYQQRMPEQCHYIGPNDVFGSVAIVPIRLLVLLAPVMAMDPTLPPVTA